jgi:hypothetical protein
MLFPKVKCHELASCFNCEADLDDRWWFEISIRISWAAMA